MDRSPIARDIDRRHWRRRGSSWLARLLLTYRAPRPLCRRTGWERRTRLVLLPFQFDPVQESSAISCTDAETLA